MPVILRLCCGCGVVFHLFFSEHHPAVFCTARTSSGHRCSVLHLFVVGLPHVHHTACANHPASNQKCSTVPAFFYPFQLIETIPQTGIYCKQLIEKKNLTELAYQQNKSNIIENKNNSESTPKWHFFDLVIGSVAVSNHQELLPSAILFH